MTKIQNQRAVELAEALRDYDPAWVIAVMTAFQHGARSVDTVEAMEFLKENPEAPATEEEADDDDSKSTRGMSGGRFVPA